MIWIKQKKRRNFDDEQIFSTAFFTGEKISVSSCVRPLMLAAKKQIIFERPFGSWISGSNNRQFCYTVCFSFLFCFFASKNWYESERRTVNVWHNIHRTPTNTYRQHEYQIHKFVVHFTVQNKIHSIHTAN